MVWVFGPLQHSFLGVLMCLPTTYAVILGSFIHKQRDQQSDLKCFQMVDAQGFEPRLAGPKPAVLPLHHASKVEPQVGLEPTTYGLQNRCTTIVLSGHKIFYYRSVSKVCLYAFSMRFLTIFLRPI